MNQGNQWFLFEEYANVLPPGPLSDFAYQNGVATVAVYKSGKSQPGWGEVDFMRNYKLGKLQAESRTNEFAYVMRSLQMLVVDIDGKNDGDEHAKLLNLPPTLAETSKSGNGYHLWYLLPDNWDDEKGYARLSDRLGLVQGVDIRATGCVFHYPQQRWNSSDVVMAPNHLINRIEVRESMHATPAQIKKLHDDDDTVEIKRLTSEALQSLENSIPPGRRNQTLFAIGSQLYLLDHEEWEDKIREKAEEVGIDQVETDKIIRNIPVYADRS